MCADPGPLTLPFVRQAEVLPNPDWRLQTVRGVPDAIRGQVRQMHGLTWVDLCMRQVQLHVAGHGAFACLFSLRVQSSMLGRPAASGCDCTSPCSAAPLPRHGGRCCCCRGRPSCRS